MRCKLRKKFLLILALVLFLAPTKSYAVIQAVEEKFIAIDTERQKANLEKIKKNLDKKNFSKEKRAKVEQLIAQNEKNIAKIEKFKEYFRNNIRIRNQIRPHLQNRDTYFTIDIGRVTTNEKISKLFLDVAKEDDYFYYGQYGSAKIDTTYNPDKSKDGKTYIEKAKFDVKYRVDIDMEYSTTDFVKKWVDENIDPTLTEYAKVKEIHDFIVKRNFYNTGDRNEESGGISIYHPASIIYGNGGVCNAYATLFDLMAREAGLETRFLTGKSLDNGEDHMWNMVKIMGNWYHIDTTWDDPLINFSDKDIENIEDFVIYDYFLKSDAEIQKSRTINKSKNRPEAPNNFPTSPDNSKIEEIDGKYYAK